MAWLRELTEWLSTLPPLGGTLSVLIIVGGALAVLALPSRRWALLAFMLVYVLSTGQFLTVMAARLLLPKLVVVLFVGLILVLSSADPPLERDGNRSPLAPWFRLGGGALATAFVLLLARNWQLPQTAADLNRPITLLVWFGALIAAVRRDPFHAGLGILLLLHGFELFYSGLDQSFSMLVTFAGLHLLVALGTALMVALQRRPRVAPQTSEPDATSPTSSP
jgi:hypothetical protein